MNLLLTVEPKAVQARRRRRLKRKRFWTAGVNDVWPQDQHDKWGRFGLWLQAGIEAFSGEINWLRVWWCNRNPKLITKYYLDKCREIGAIPVLTQSDPGSENFGVANAHTVMRHRLDTSLDNTLQHRFLKNHGNILSEIKWSIFRRDFSPGFEDILEEGVREGWYDVDDTLENLVFRWVAIPWIQAEIDKWVSFKNRTSPRADRNKILPLGIPFLIRSKPHHFNVLDFKIPVSKELFDEMEVKYAPCDDPVFQLVPPLFNQRANDLYAQIGQPAVSSSSMWEVYRQLLHQFRTNQDPGLESILTSHCSTMEDLEKEPEMEVLDMKPFQLGSHIGPKNAAYIGGVLVPENPSGSETDDSPSVDHEYADFTSDSEPD